MAHRRRLIVSLLALMSITGLAAVGRDALAGVNQTLSSPTPSFETLCEQVLTRAIAVTEARCEQTARNEACYGYTDVTSAFQPGVDLSRARFESIGDIVPIQSLARIETSGLDVEQATWGMAILKLQANLPDTNPGQNVTFLLFGKTSLRPSEGQTNAFYLSTELGQLTCNQIPSSSLVVRAPHQVQVSFTLNDVQIRLASTLVFSAEGNVLRVKALEGHARVTAAGITRNLIAGQELRVPLNPDTGAANGAPSEPTLLEYDPAFDSIGALVDTVSGEATGGLITIGGPIELIDSEGGWITVDGRRLRMDPQALARLRVGQQFTFTGFLRGFSIVSPSPTPAATPVPSTLNPLPQTVSAPATSVSLPRENTATPSATFTPTDTLEPTSTPTDTLEPTLTPTDTLEPTSTPTDTLEPTLTPTDTLASPLSRLLLTAECSPDPALYRVWTVTNPNPIDVDFEWRVRSSTQTGVETAPANGQTTFSTLTEAGSNTVQIWVDGELHDSRSGNADRCP